MRKLFDMDAKNYAPTMRRFVRPSARGIVIRQNKIELVHVAAYDYYKFPGGGIDPGETPIEALIREVREEAGLHVIPESVTEYGMVHRIEYHAEHGDVFDQENYYYCCEAEPERDSLELEEYEEEEGLTPVLIEPQAAVRANRKATELAMEKADGYDGHYAMATEIKREMRVLELLIEESFFGSE